MIQTQPIMILELIQRCTKDTNILDKLPEFDFLKPIVEKVKKRGCFCGVNQELTNLISQFNEVVKNLTEEMVKKITTIFNINKLCFGIIENAKFEIKCYD